MELKTNTITESTSLLRLEENSRRTTELKRRVLEVDPNRGRCIIENYSAEHAVQYCHIVARKHMKNRRLVRCGSDSGSREAHHRY